MKPVTPIQRAAAAKPLPHDGKVQGEGDYTAARRHRTSVEKFVKSGQVDGAARDAEPNSPVEEAEMFDAERAGEQRSKGEDP